MDAGSILVVLALTLLAGLFVARPIVEGRGLAVSALDRRLSALKAELEQVMALIQEMDMDQAMDKIQPEDYAGGRAVLVGRGAALMRQIDELDPSPAATRAPAAAATDAEIEAEVARLRSRTEAAPGVFCAQCGRRAKAGDRFCVQCGSPLAPKGA
jgi:hypothetical protein